MHLPWHPCRRPIREVSWQGLAGLLLIAASLHADPAGPIVPPHIADDSGKIVFEEWSLLLLDHKRCGFDSTVTTRMETPQGPHFSTVEQEEFVLKRMNVNLKTVETSKITEDADGGVLSFDERTAGAGSNIESTGIREGDDLVVSSRGQVSRFHVPRLAALGPEAVRRLGDALSLKAGQPFSFPTFESDYPQAPVVEVGSVIGPDLRKIGDVMRPLWKITTTNSLMPKFPTASWVDAQGNDVESIITVPGVGALDEVVSTRAECMKQPEGAEIFATSLIHPQRAIPKVKQQAQAIYRITSADRTQTLPFWNQGEQRLLTSAPGVITLQVTVSDLSPTDVSWRLPHPDTPEFHPYLQASAYLEVNSPEIQALAIQAVGDENNPVRAARLIEHFVNTYITKKDLNVGFASAEETAKAREGDCTEHAVLCAALGRAVGLPTRCVIGLGYIPPGVDEPTITNGVDRDTGIFGFHMWAEAWLAPGQWMAMDAALDGFDVGHIAIIKSALEEIDPLTDLNLPILELMQQLKIDVLKTVPKEKPVSPAGVN